MWRFASGSWLGSSHLCSFFTMLRTSFHPTIAHLGLAPASSLFDSVIVIPLTARAPPRVNGSRLANRETFQPPGDAISVRLDSPPTGHEGAMRVETFALFSDIAYLAAGLLGLVPGGLMPAPTDAPPIHVTLLHGYLLGLFAVNVLHSAVHFAIGLWGIVAERGMKSPKVYARSLAIFYGALAV